MKSWVWIVLAVVAFLLYRQGKLNFFSNTPSGGTGMEPAPPTNGGVIPTLPGGPVINCIMAPCPGSGDFPTREPIDTDAPVWFAV
jgi:hypothetical protein